MDGNKMLAIIEEAKKAVNTAIHVQGVSHFAATGKQEDVQAVAQLLRRLSGEFGFLQRECLNLAGSVTLPQ